MALRNRPLIMDCDGVLLDWLAGFSIYASQRLGRALDPEQNRDFDISHWLGTSKAETIAMIKAYNRNDNGHFERLEAMPHAREVLRAAHDARKRRELSGVHVVTSCSRHPDTVRARKHNLESVFGTIFDDIICLDPQESKSDILSAFPAGIWVEDKYENAVIGADIGHDTYILRQNYNISYEETCRHPRVTWIDDWSVIARHEAPLRDIVAAAS